MDAGFHPGAKAEFSEISEALQKGAGQLFMASPENRTLACGDEGMGAMASVVLGEERVYAPEATDCVIFSIDGFYLGVCPTHYFYR